MKLYIIQLHTSSLGEEGVIGYASGFVPGYASGFVPGMKKVPRILGLNIVISLKLPFK